MIRLQNAATQILLFLVVIEACPPSLSSLEASFYALHLLVRGGSTEKSVMQDDQSPSVQDTDFVLGGGAINEKERGLDVAVSNRNKADAGRGSSHYDPCHTRSHLWHALEGLDRYPNYLSRWQVEDMDQLEEALEAQLDKVRQQKKAIVGRRHGIDQLINNMVERDKKWCSLLTPPHKWDEVKRLLNPKAAEAFFKSKQFVRAPPPLHDVLGGRAHVKLDPGLLENIMDQECFDVYSLPLLSVEFCNRLKAYIQEVIVLGSSEEFAYLNLGRRPIDLDTIGLGWVNDLLFHLVMRPVSRLLFKDSEALDELDWRQGYIAGYSVDPSVQTGTTRHRLVPHTDDSEVTMNLCIGDQFDGGTLQFHGLRGTRDADERKLIGDFQPQLGTALLHSGRHLHEVTQVTSGDRYAYIIWARSWRGSRAQTCPCCWLNRRESSSCICGPRWN